MLRTLLFAALAACVAAEGVQLINPLNQPEEVISRIPMEDDAVCIDKQLAQCQYGFNHFLNISDNAHADWSNPKTLVYIIQQYFNQGVDGMLKVCKARTHLHQCLGDSYRGCMSRLRFVRSGQSLANAQMYTQIFHELDFQCNGGLLQTTQHWDCILSMKARGDKHYQGCLDSYNAAVKADPSKTCLAAAEFTTCARVPYTTYCGNDVGWWECERVRVALSLNNMCPDLQCQTNHFNVAAPAANPLRAIQQDMHVSDKLMSRIGEVADREKQHAL